MNKNKSDIIEAIAESAEISKVAAQRALDAFINSVKEFLQNGDQVSLVGFGIFDVKERAARAGRNPKTGATIQINATRVPSFKAGKALKDAVSGKQEVVSA